MPLPLSSLLALAAALDRAALADELQAAPPQAEPSDVPDSAMCYEPMAIEGDAVFACPVCGARTTWDGVLAARVLELTEAVRAAQAALPPPTADLAVEIDASGLCRRCNPDGAPDLALVVRRAGQPAHRTQDLSADDLRLVVAFLADARAPTEKLAALPQAQAARTVALLGLAPPAGAAP